ncbi:Immunoglobulin-like domain-containing receptor 2 [Bagarius yarrelli]|nr:Immunoglobulin-like domain-containing receptor 2 [Bagarius yarrelli]
MSSEFDIPFCMFGVPTVPQSELGKVNEAKFSLRNNSTPCCEAVQVSVRDERRFALLFQSVVLPCQYTSTSTHTPVVQWWYKSYCRDRTRDSFSFPDSLGVRGSELGATSHLDCNDNSRTVRVVASGQGSSLTIADYYKDRDIAIINKADLRIGQLQWGDSGVYYCKVVIADDLEGQNEAHVELLVLGQTGVADDLLPEIDLEIMPEWLFVVVVALGGILFFVLAGVCWCQCCPHSCCCYVRCCCCPETCCCPRHLYEAGKGIKPAPSTPVAFYPPYYMQGMPSMVPIPPPSLIEPKMSTAPSVDNSISISHQPLAHSGYRLQPTPDQSSLKVLQYVERELAHFNPSKTLSSHDSCSMSELSSLHEAETDFHQAYRKVQKKALPAIPDMDDPPDILSREKSPVHTQTSARIPHHRVKEDQLRWNPRSEHLQRKAFQMGGRTGSLDELEEFAMRYVQRRRHDDFSDDEDDHVTCTKQRQCEPERERRREEELDRDRYPYYSSKRYSPKDPRDRPRPPSPPPVLGHPKRRGTGDSSLRHDFDDWDTRRREREFENGQDYDDAFLNSILERKAKGGKSLSLKSGRNGEESDRPSKNSSQKSCYSHSPSNKSASNRPVDEDDSLPPYAEREPERFRGAVNSHQPSTSTRTRKEQENKEELSRPRKVTFYDEQNSQVDSDVGFSVTVRFVPRFDHRK